MTPLLRRNLALVRFGKLLIVFWVNLLYILCLMALRCCPLHLIKQNFVLNFFLKSRILMTHISLIAFPSRTNLQLHNIPVTSKLKEEIITDLYPSKASCTDCIPVVVLKNYVLNFHHNSWPLQYLCSVAGKRTIQFCVFNRASTFPA